ncbi:hypothetical protein GCK72_019567 [Caenorhabditis remanei]|uniref:Uncharacterized protein n=1 Tax=Caenorhabditis remanei TaxID=31234 RepID=A0A6A5GEH1_CAERE|nr:hypothetical protein GCK72_019567 [Caenorhabditis remanei]KAF1753011.1 hypothetical protein GCK72_019567 [Caenorhabditis remanei]
MCLTCLIFIICSNYIHADNESFQATCDQQCIFNEISVNTETLKLFPINCSTVCGYLQLSSDSNVTEDQLTTVFKNMKKFYGLVEIVSTPSNELFVFKNNHENLTSNPSVCLRIKQSLNTTAWHIPMIDGKSCEEIEEVAAEKDSSGEGNGRFIAQMLALFLFYYAPKVI